MMLRKLQWLHDLPAGDRRLVKLDRHVIDPDATNSFHHCCFRNRGFSLPGGVDDFFTHGTLSLLGIVLLLLTS